MENKLLIDLYTDGACRGNPGIGAYAFVILVKNINGDIVLDTNNKKAFTDTTNNKMELSAVISGLEKINELNINSNRINIYTDSQYIVKAFNDHWIDNWIKNDFRRNKKDEVKNIDLWEKLLFLLDKYDYTFVWVKGHSGNKYNELCDKLCNIEMDKYK